jgi:hypothetical protein
MRKSSYHVNATGQLFPTQKLPKGEHWVSKTIGTRCGAISEAINCSRAQAAALERQDFERRDAVRRVAIDSKPQWWSSDHDLASTDGELFEGIYDEWWVNLEALWKVRYKAHFGSGLADGRTAFEKICRDAGSHAEIPRAISPHVRRSLWFRVDAESRLEPAALLGVLRKLSQGPFRLMDLPACVRRCVYEQFDDIEWTIAAGRIQVDPGKRPVPAILHVSRELRDVAMSLMTIRINFDVRLENGSPDETSRWYRDLRGRDLVCRVKEIHISFLPDARFLGNRQHVIISRVGVERRWRVSREMSRLGQRVRETTWRHHNQLPQHIEAALEAVKDCGGEPIDAVMATAAERWNWALSWQKQFDEREL